MAPTSCTYSKEPSPFDAVAFRTRAEIDFVTLRFETARRTNFHTVQKRLGEALGRGPEDPKIRVHALNTGPGEAATRFKAQFHDIECFAELQEALRVLASSHELIGEVMVDTLEVSLDFYPRDATRESARQFAEHLARRLKANDRNPRLGGDKGTIVLRKAPDLPLTLRERTFYVGNTDDPVRWRVYLKQTDHGRMLRDDEVRARAEVTLSGNSLTALGINTLTHLRQFNFSLLSRLLRFRRLHLPESDGTPLQQVTRSWLRKFSTQQGQRGMFAIQSPEFRLRNGYRRKNSRVDRADPYLNKVSRDALRYLTIRVSQKET